MTRKQKTGAIVLLSITALWGLICYAAGELRGVLLFGMALVGEAAMLVVLSLDRRKETPPGKTTATIIATLGMAGAAKALIPIAIGVGVGVGLIGWGGIKIWSAILSIEAKKAKRPAVAQVETTTDDGIQVADKVTSRLPSYDFQSGTNAAAAVPREQPEQPAIYVSIVVPAGYTLEYSTNLVTWGAIHTSVLFDEETWWIPDGPQGFFRYKADSEPDPINAQR